MWKFIEKRIPLFLFIFFIIFYSVQIPTYTYKADVLTFAIRSIEEKPVSEYAYLDSNTLLYDEALPNYHIGHTVALWFAYNIFPTEFSNSIWPAGFISALCSAFSIVLTYLIWLYLGLSKRESLTVAIVFGLIPSFWEHSIIGEIHAIQILFILLFIYSFLKEKLFFSTLFFLIANLISPLSGLAFTFLFLRGITKKNLVNAIIVGFFALVAYIIIFYLLGADLTKLISPLSQHQSERGIIYRTLILVFFILINFNFFSFYLIKGIWNTYISRKQIIIHLLYGILPQIGLLFISAGFFIENGSFQLLLFWALAVPLGIYLSKIHFRSFSFAASLVASIALTYYIWLEPHNKIGTSLSEAGEWLRINQYENYSIIGPWDVGINILESRNGHRLKYLNSFFYDQPYPTFENIKITEKSKLIIANNKKSSLRQLVAKTGLPGLQLDEYNPEDVIKTGRIKKLFDNDFVTLYEWER